MRWVWLLPLAVLLVGRAPGQAQEPADTGLQALLARRVTVGHFQTVASASRFSERAADAPAAVTVVTAEDIRRMGAVTIAEALRMVPGLNVITVADGTTTLTARNGIVPISPRVLILLDGRPTAMELYSYTDWAALPVTLNQVEAIEVVRGPGSTLYGANAYDAVIDITTVKPGVGTSIDASAATS